MATGGDGSVTEAGTRPEAQRQRAGRGRPTERVECAGAPSRGGCQTGCLFENLHCSSRPVFPPV